VGEEYAKRRPSCQKIPGSGKTHGKDKNEIIKGFI
jgi:hypothetical protein